MQQAQVACKCIKPYEMMIRLVYQLSGISLLIPNSPFGVVLPADAASTSGQADVPRPHEGSDRADGLWGYCQSRHALQLRAHTL